MSNEIIESGIEILHETPKAIMIENFNEENIWIPKSKIKICNDGLTMQIPEWLAIEKELF